MASVVSQELIGFEPYANRFTTRFAFTLDDGRVITRGPAKVSSLEAAEAKLLDMVAYVEDRISESDADTVVSDDGPIVNKKTARKYLQRAMQEDTLKAYRMLNRAYNYFTANGWSGAQVKAQLNISDRQWDAVLARYQFCQSNSAAIEGFMALDDPRGEF